MATFYGYLHSQPQTTSGNFIDILLGLDGGGFAPKRSNRLVEVSGWDQADFISRRPLRSDDIKRSEQPDFIGGPYHYPFYLRENRATGNILIASELFLITNEIVKSINTRLSQNISRFHINISKLLEFLDDPEKFLATEKVPGQSRELLVKRSKTKEYFTSRLHVSVTKYGKKLDSMTLNGNDVLKSGFLEDFGMSDFSARSIGLRHKDDYSETLHLQATGGIQIYDDRMGNLESTLGLISLLNAFDSTN